MDFPRPLGAAVFAGALIGLSPVVRAQDAAPPPTDADTQARLQALEARIARQDQEISQLRDEQGQQWLDGARTEEVKALVRDVLSDADTRASLQDQGVTAGHGEHGYFLSSEDGNISLSIGGIIQIRYIADFRRGATGPAPTDDNESGFQISRTKLDFQGKLGTDNLIYRIRLAVYRDTGTVVADTVTIGYKPTDDLIFSAGRFKEAFTREDILSDPFSSIAVDRSIANTIFSAQYVEGVQTEWQPAEWIKLVGSINDGARSGTAPLDSGNALVPVTTGMDFENGDTQFAASLRADYKVLGDWKQYVDFSSWSQFGGKPALFFGGAIHYQVSKAAVAVPANNFILWTADSTYKQGPLSLFAAAYGHDETKATAGAAHYNDQAYLLQAGYMVIPDKLEPFARYEYITLDGRRSSSTDPISAVTAGVNWYIAGQSAKFTLDVVYIIDPLSANSTGSTSFTQEGLLPDANGKSNQTSIRAQLQLMF